MTLEVEVFNPHNKPLEELPTIYGFNNGGKPEWYYAQLITENGIPIGGHICSHECYMPKDLGIQKGSRSDRQEGFKKHYPNGYKMEFVGLSDVSTHKGLQRAFELNNKLEPEELDNKTEEEKI